MVVVAAIFVVGVAAAVLATAAGGVYAGADEAKPLAVRVAPAAVFAAGADLSAAANFCDGNAGSVLATAVSLLPHAENGFHAVHPALPPERHPVSKAAEAINQNER